MPCAMQEGTETFLSFIDSRSTEALVMLAISDLMAIKSPPVSPHSDLEVINGGLIDQPGLVSSSRAMKVLFAAACEGKRILPIIIEKL